MSEVKMYVEYDMVSYLKLKTMINCMYMILMVMEKIPG